MQSLCLRVSSQPVHVIADSNFKLPEMLAKRAGNPLMECDERCVGCFK
jgi:hypothetical protein